MTSATRPLAQAVLAFQPSEVGRGYGRELWSRKRRDVLGGLPGIEPELGKESVNILSDTKPLDQRENRLRIRLCSHGRL